MATLSLDVINGKRIRTYHIAYDASQIPQIMRDLKILKLAERITDWDHCSALLQMALSVARQHQMRGG